MEKNIINRKKFNMKKPKIFRQKSALQLFFASHINLKLAKWPADGKSNVLVYAEKRSKCRISIISVYTYTQSLGGFTRRLAWYK